MNIETTIKFCCKVMEANFNFDSDNKTITFYEFINGHISQRIQENGWRIIDYCPWCGKKIVYSVVK